MIVDDWLARRAETCPERIALIAGGVELDYAELEREAVSTARRLAGDGIGPGSVVALRLEPGAEAVILVHALAKLGAVAHPVSPRLSGPELRAELARSGAEVVLERAPAGREAAEVELAAEHEAGAICSLISTSGTTGEARAVGLSYGNHLWSAVGSAFNLGVDPGDRWLCCLPLHHVSGLAIVLRSAIYGTGAVVHPGFEPGRVAEALERDGVTVVSLVATQLARLLEHGVDLSGPRAILVGGGPVPEDVLAEARARGAAVAPTYGLTEAASQVTTLAPAEAGRGRGSAGRPLLGTRVRIDAGEILVRGPTVAPGLAGEDGWLRTGDLGSIDVDGFLRVTGRLGDVIVTAGENVAPDEVESVLLRHPLVADAAVVGRPDPEWQEAVTAVVVPAPGGEPGAEELRAHCAAELAGHKVPKRFELASELPRTASGKLRRGELR